MSWTPLVSSTFFDGVRIDLVTATVGIVSLSLITLGAVMIVRAIGK